MKITRTSYVAAAAAGFLMSAAVAHAAAVDVPVEKPKTLASISELGPDRLIPGATAVKASGVFRTAGNRTRTRMRFVAPRRAVRKAPVAVNRQFGVKLPRQHAAPRSGTERPEIYGFSHEVMSSRDAPTPPPPPPPPPQHNDDCMSCD